MKKPMCDRRHLPLGLSFLLLILLAAKPTDPAHRFLGSWEGPANVYDDTQVMKPTNARVVIAPAADRPGEYLVELTLFGDKLSRFTHCRLVKEGELRVQDEVTVDLRRVKVDGTLKARGADRIDEGYILFLVETPNGGFRPYHTVKFAAKRRPEVAPPAPTPVPGLPDGS